MSEHGCDEPGCSEVLAEVYLLIDKECPNDQAAEIRRHLDGCAECREQYGISDHIKRLLARKCGGDHAPDQLKERLRATIRRTVVQRGGVSTSEVTLEVAEEN